MAITSQDWFHDHVKEDKEFVSSVGQQGMIILKRCFNITIHNQMLPIAIYGVIMDVIKDVLKDKEKTNSSYAINIADMLEIGFTAGFDDENSDAEKIGNFVLYMKNLKSKTSWKEIGDGEKSSKLCVEWYGRNISHSLEDIKEICSRANDALRTKIGVYFETPEMVMVFFCTIHSQIMETAKLQYSVESKDGEDIMLNFAGLFDIIVMNLEDGLKIQMKPQVADKGNFKNDNMISSKYE